MNDDPALPDLRPILLRYPRLHDRQGRLLPFQAAELPVRRLAGGLINDTFALGETHILQRLHPIFRAEVNLDIRDLTAHLRADGVPVPRIEEADDRRPWIETDEAATRSEAGVWRILSRLPGETRHQLQDPAQAESAATLIAHFHHALLPLRHRFAFSRPGAHDTSAHIKALQGALEELPSHRLAAEVRPLADELLSRWRALPQHETLPKRIIHGDLKVSNLLFDERGQACGIIDLDTMGWSTMDVELGDGLRSWCNRAREHDAQAHLDLDLLRAALGAYRRETRGWLRPEEARGLLPGMLRITLELSARFAADALRERYFGWSREIAPSQGDHNLLRARNQLDLARQLDEAMDELKTSVSL